MIPFIVWNSAISHLYLDKCTKLSSGYSGEGYDSFGYQGAALTSKGDLYLHRGFTIYKAPADSLDLDASLVQQSTTVYEHNSYIMDLKIRWWKGRETVFFSSHVTGQNTIPSTIYYLNTNNQAVPYHTINGLPIENPSNPGEWVDVNYNGEFAFDDQNNLYVSLGKCPPTWLYRLTGAGDNGVTGAPEQIFKGNTGGINNLSCGYNNNIYFSTILEGGYFVVRELNLSTNEDSHIAPFPDGAGFCLMTAPHKHSHATLHVKWLQVALNTVMGAQLAVDGIYGVATKTAVTQFQSEHALVQDGVAGHETFNVLRPLFEKMYVPPLIDLNPPPDIDVDLDSLIGSNSGQQYIYGKPHPNLSTNNKKKRKPIEPVKHIERGS